jgi:hypothetical protein
MWNARIMKTTFVTLGISAILTGTCCAQPYGTSVAPNLTVTNAATPGKPTSDPAAYYATLNRQEIEFTARLELLNQLAQEQKKRADDAPPEQAPKAQWERSYSKELADRAAATLVLLNNTTKDRIAFEQKHPNFTSPFLPSSTSGVTNSFNSIENAFLAKLAERRGAIEQEIAASIEAANLYAAQMATNTGAYDATRLSSLMQDNGYYLKQLQRELFDLDLKNLEFRALRRP